jgi:hypothetical protein
VIDEANGHAGVLSERRGADDRDPAIALDLDLEEVSRFDAGIFRLEIIPEAAGRQQPEERSVTGARLYNRYEVGSKRS